MRAITKFTGFASEVNLDWISSLRLYVSLSAHNVLLSSTPADQEQNGSSHISLYRDKKSLMYCELVAVQEVHSLQVSYIIYPQ